MKDKDEYIKNYSCTLIIALTMYTATSMSDDSVNHDIQGIYYCMTERMIGIQPKELPSSMKKEFNSMEDVKTIANWQMKNRYSGIINPLKKTFVVKIKHYEVTPEIKKSETCTKTDPVVNGNFTILGASIRNILECNDRTKYKVELPEGKHNLVDGPVLYSTQGSNFTNGSTTFVIFINDVYNEITYHLTSLNYIQGNYIEEGQCETFE